jgi:hypothetical protein
MATIQPAINALIWTGYLKGENIVITHDAFLRGLATFNLVGHTSEVHHVSKPDDDLGRLLFDYSNITDGTPVNGSPADHPWLIEQYKKRYGLLTYPTFSYFIRCCWDAQACFPGEPIGMAKTDVRRAYHTIGWTPTGSLKLAIHFAPGLVAIPLTCGFGKGEPPYAFGPISRWLDHKHILRMRERVPPIELPLSGTFVDDTVTTGSLDFLAVEVPASETVINTDIHSTATNIHKRCITQRCDVLGIRMNTATNRAGISYKAYLKLVYVFFIVLPPEVTTSTMLPIKCIQCVAGLARHYGFYIPPLRYTASTFYQALRGRATVKSLNNRQVAAVKFWRDYLRYAFRHAQVLSSTLHDLYYNDPVTSSRSPPSGPQAYSDASLNILGCYVPDLGWCAIYARDFVPTDGVTVTIAHLELLAFIATYLLAIHLSPSIPSIHIYIDNQNAQAWASGTFCTTNLITNHLSMITCCLQTVYNVPHTRSYIRSEENVNADNASRARFNKLDSKLRCYPTPRLLKFLAESLTHSDSDPSLTLLAISTTLDSAASSLFSSSSDSP